jgi:hypothetical protein
MAPHFSTRKFICFLAIPLAACTAGQPAAPRPQFPGPTTAPQAGVWDAEPHALDIHTVTPATRCEFTYRAKDGTYVALGLAYGVLLLVINRTGQIFPETVNYDVRLQSPQNVLSLKMRPAAGRVLMTTLSFANDPNHLLPSILQAGFMLTVSAPNNGVVLAEQIPSPGPFDMMPFQVCVSMVQRKLQPAKSSNPETQ